MKKFIPAFSIFGNRNLVSKISTPITDRDKTAFSLSSKRIFFQSLASGIFSIDLRPSLVNRLPIKTVNKDEKKPKEKYL